MVLNIIADELMDMINKDECVIIDVREQFSSYTSRGTPYENEGSNWELNLNPFPYFTSLTFFMLSSLILI